MAKRGDQSQVVYVDGDVPQLPIQLGQLLVDSSQISPGTTNLQQCTSQNPLTYEPLQGGYPITAAEIAAGVTPANRAYDTYDIRRYGALVCSHSDTAQQALNKAAIQTAISVMNADVTRSGGMVWVPSGCQWGYNYLLLSSFPDFTGVTVPVVIEDYSLGDTFAGYPTIYDGAQVRFLYYTPPTFGPLTFTAALSGGAVSGTLTTNWTGLTGPQNVFFSNGDVRNVTFTNGATTATWTTGLSSAATADAEVWTFNHVGNTEIIRAEWNPGVFIINDAILAAPGDPSRTTYDNRRCQLSFGWSTGSSTHEAWKVGQGTQQGVNFTDEEMANFAIQKVEAAGDTRGSFGAWLIERKTGNQSFGIITNVPRASFDYYAPLAGYDIALFENAHSTTCTIRLRNSTGSSNDAGISTTSDRLSLFNTNGEALSVIQATRDVLIGTTTDDPCAKLNVTSTTQGLLLPRMTTAQRDAISSPTAGLLIYNTTTNKLNIRAAAAWEAVTSV